MSSPYSKQNQQDARLGRKYWLLTVLHPTRSSLTGKKVQGKNLTQPGMSGVGVAAPAPTKTTSSHGRFAGHAGRESIQIDHGTPLVLVDLTVRATDECRDNRLLMSVVTIVGVGRLADPLVFRHRSTLFFTKHTHTYYRHCIFLQDLFRETDGDERCKTVLAKVQQLRAVWVENRSGPVLLVERGVVRVDHGKEAWECPEPIPFETALHPVDASASAFVTTNLDYVLRRLPRRSMVVAGKGAETAIESTVRDGADKG